MADPLRYLLRSAFVSGVPSAGILHEEPLQMGDLLLLLGFVELPADAVLAIFHFIICMSEMARK